MTEPIGYNDEKFDDLPDPDSSWDKMNQLLDKEEKRRRILPFWFRLSALGILLAGIAITGWLLFSGDDNKPLTETVREDVSSKSQTPATNPQQRSSTNSESEILEHPGGAGIQQNGDASNTAGFSKPDQILGHTPKDEADANTIKSTGKSPVKLSGAKRSEDNVSPVSANKKSNSVIPRNNLPAPIGNETGKRATKKTDDTVTPAGAEKDSAATNAQTMQRDSLTAAPAQVIGVDSAAADKRDTAKLKEAVADAKDKTKKKDRWQWSLALAFQQPVAIGPQGTSGYNYRGKKSFIADHLPGVAVTAGKDKWFAGAEFNYGVPQPVKQVYFSQSTKYDPAGGTVNVERFSVEKMYYHQLSVSANYYLFSRLSAGAGGTYNLLTGAVTQQELKSSNINTGETQTKYSLAPVNGYKDSFLFKSTAAAFFQSEYHWNRIKVGVRYTYSLQPYMRYTKPDGHVEDVKNNTLQLLLRLQLWRK